MTTVQIRRQTNPYSDQGRRYRVLLDEREIGSLKWGEVGEFPVDPGTHTLRLKIDWTGSPAMAFELDEGQVAQFVCRPQRSMVAAVYSLIRSINHRTEWLVLERA
jgi:hypothetical protein